MRRPLTPLLTIVVSLLAVLLVPRLAQAGPAGTSGKASFDTRKGGKSSGSSSGFEWPEMVYGGNAIQGQFPLQVGLVGYLPRARFAFQYDRQVWKQHWLHGGIALLFDRADFTNFRMDACGFESVAGKCDPGGVIGFDLYAGYAYKFFLQERPWLVPIVRANIGYSYFALPKVTGGDASREQTRTRSQAITLRPGAGLRLFLLKDLAVGVDLNIPFGALIHRNLPNGSTNANTEGGFLLGLEILPLLVEYRF